MRMSKLAFSVREGQRLLAYLEKLDPADDMYYRVLYNLSQLLEHKADIDAIDVVGQKDAPIISEEKLPETKQEEKQVTEEVVTEEPYEEDDSPTGYTLSDIRAALIAAKKKGFDSSGLVRSYGVDNVTAVPASKYNEIMKKIEEYK